MKQDNRGLTLIELIIAVAVSTIILGATFLFIRNSLHSYEVATNAVDLQMESHVMMEQVGAWIMEGNRIDVVKVNISMPGGSEETGTPADVLVIYKIPRTADIGRLPTGVVRDANGNLTTDLDSGVDNPDLIQATKRLIWMQDNRLYTKVIDNVTNFDSDVTTAVPDVDEWGDCICEYFEVFTPTWVPDKATVKIDVMLKAGVQEYEVENEFKVRNEILATPSPTP